MLDCFECAITALAPEWPRRGNRVIGHGVKDAEQIYGSVNGARESGVDGGVDAV